jgi:hypothetical protein
VGYEEKKTEPIPELLLMPGTPPEFSIQYPALFLVQTGIERLC